MNFKVYLLSVSFVLGILEGIGNLKTKMYYVFFSSFLGFFVRKVGGRVLFSDFIREILFVEFYEVFSFFFLIIGYKMFVIFF